MDGGPDSQGVRLAGTDVAVTLDRWGPPVDIAGFAWRDRNGVGYYWTDSTVNTICHNLEAERLLLNGCC